MAVDKPVDKRPRRVENSGRDSGKLVRQKHGGALLRGGKLGNRGGNGRPRKTAQEEALERIRALSWPDLTGANGGTAWDYLVMLTKQGETHSVRLKALQLLLAYAYGLPKQQIEATVEGLQPTVVVVPATMRLEDWVQKYRQLAVEHETKGYLVSETEK